MYTQCSLKGATLRGVKAVPVDVEVAVSNGIPHFAIVGMGDASIQESRERVRAALHACGYSLPSSRILVNLAPSSLRKSGSGFDLPIALGILAATGQINIRAIQDALFVGELSLEGQIRPVPGLLAYAQCAYEQGIPLICSASGEGDFPFKGLRRGQVLSLNDFRNNEFQDTITENVYAPKKDGCEVLPDYQDIVGHEAAKRALQIAAAGRHGLLMMGPPGSGKTMLASRLASILPPMNQEESLETAIIHSVAGLDWHAPLSGIRPVRMPHHSATTPGLVGGGSPIRPGEISLAHNGVLFLDELAEFKPSVLQSMRTPMEAGYVHVTRADGTLRFPSSFMFLAASNPCPCGYFGDPKEKCSCSEAQIRAYQGKIGGPLIDRIDMRIDIQRLPSSMVLKSGKGKSSAQLRDEVLNAWSFRSWRESMQAVEESGEAARSAQGLIQSCKLEDKELRYVEMRANEDNYSGRSLINMLSVARTIADMQEAEKVQIDHLLEAMSLRIWKRC